MRVHAGRESWLIHATMRSMLHKLGREEFVHLHRSALVKCDHIERLVHKGRHWTARLKDGSLQQIAKSHVVDVLRRSGSSRLRLVAVRRRKNSWTVAPSAPNEKASCMPHDNDIQFLALIGGRKRGLT
jgi:hypothetical protein